VLLSLILNSSYLIVPLSVAGCTKVASILYATALDSLVTTTDEAVTLDVEVELEIT